MAEIDSILVNLEDETKDANTVKDIVLCRLLASKVITDEQAKEYSEKWQIIIIKRSWFEKWRLIFSSEKDKNGYIYKYVRFED